MMKKSLLDNIWIIPILIVSSIISLIYDRLYWDEWRLPVIVLLIVIDVSVSLGILFNKYFIQIFKGILAYRQYIENIVKIASSPILAIMFTLYVLSPNPGVGVPPSLQFNVVVISATLGGLVLAGASNRRISRRVNNKLIMVAKNFIYATILFIVFSILMYWVESTGGIDTNTIDFSSEGILRGGLFYIGAICFFSGILLFSFSLIDLGFTLRKIKHKS